MTDEDTSTGPQEGTEDRTILLIGSGPIQIGQAAEFDYSGAQACRALREEGARVVLVNSNPATIMTDPEMADKVYIEPITTEAISEIIERERPDGVIAGLGGQTGLNVTAELAEEGVLEEFDVDVMGTPLDTIYATEDRDLFRQRMEDIGEPVPRSTTITLDDGESVTDLDEDSLIDRVESAVDEVGGLPVIARTTYTLGGSGSGVVDEMDELIERVRKGLRLSRNSEVLITESISGWVELEYEVMRDADDSCIIICNMENIDPMGIHTGESTVVTPSQVIPDEGHQEMRDAALQVIRDLGIQGGCNIQFAWHDDGTPGGEYRVVEVNPRVSRSSALASKATGYPIARVTAKVALGKRLHEITNEITGETTAAFEPAIDYVVTKVPRWPKDKFTDVDFELSTAMKSTGEAMSIGRTFEESLLKALRSSEYDPAADCDEVDDEELEAEYLEKPTPDRPYAIFEAFERGYTTEDVVELTDIHEWYVERFGRVVDGGRGRPRGRLRDRRHAGHDQETTALAGGEFNDTHVSWLPADLDEDGGDEPEVEAATEAPVSQSTPSRRRRLTATSNSSTPAGEFEATTPYYTRRGTRCRVSTATNSRSTRTSKVSWSSVAAPSASGRASSSTTVRSTRCRRSATWASTRTSSTTTPRRCRPTTTPPTASFSTHHGRRGRRRHRGDRRGRRDAPVRRPDLGRHRPPARTELDRRGVDCEISARPSTRWTSPRTATASTA